MLSSYALGAQCQAPANAPSSDVAPESVEPEEEESEKATEAGRDDDRFSIYTYCTFCSILSYCTFLVTYFSVGRKANINPP